MGQTVHVLDPFSKTTETLETLDLAPATFNPLEFIDDGPSGITQADRIADTLILREQGDNRFFSTEGRALLKAIILHVQSAENYEGHRHLEEINGIVSDPFTLIGGHGKDGEMQANEHAYFGLVKRIAHRMAAKEERERSAVWSTVQANLSEFLDDPFISGSLRTSSFDFAALAGGNTTIYAVMPVQYLETFNRWYRMLLGSALDRLMEYMGEDRRPDVPTLCVLEEFASAIGNLQAASTAFNLGRGAGLKLWVVLQSLSQLTHHYGQDGRENFVANSGAIEVFGLNANDDCAYCRVVA